MKRILARLASWNWTGVHVGISVLLVCLLGWFFAWRDPAKEARPECERLYARAATAADTARVDRMEAGGSKYGPWSCGLLRRAGTS
jgi:hypothetical protein